VWPVESQPTFRRNTPRSSRSNSKICFLEKSVDVYQATRDYIPEDKTFQDLHTLYFLPDIISVTNQKGRHGRERFKLN
jgi:hypothetical protein